MQNALWVAVLSLEPEDHASRHRLETWHLRQGTDQTLVHAVADRVELIDAIVRSHTLTSYRKLGLYSGTVILNACCTLFSGVFSPEEISDEKCCCRAG
jgi:hypothetical protein